MKRFDSINMIPFIDIMLVLLTIVLTTATFISQGLIDVDLPQATSAQPQTDPPKHIEIAVNASNQIFLEGKPLTIQELSTALKPHPVETQIVLRVDKTTQFEHFIQLIDVLKTTKFENISIQTEQQP